MQPSIDELWPPETVQGTRKWLRNLMRGIDQDPEIANEFAKATLRSQGGTRMQKAFEILFHLLHGARIRHEEKLMLTAETLSLFLGLNAWAISCFRNNQTPSLAFSVMIANWFISPVLTRIVEENSGLLHLASNVPAKGLTECFPTAHQAALNVVCHVNDCLRRAAEATNIRTELLAKSPSQIMRALRRGEYPPFATRYLDRLVNSFGDSISEIDVSMLRAAIVLECDKAIEKLRGSNAVPQPSNPDRPTDGTAPNDPLDSIIYVGEDSFRINQRTESLTPIEADVLKAFLLVNALSLKALAERSQVSSPNKILTRLKSKYGGIFGPAIQMAESAGNGGYKVKIIDRSSPPTNRPQVAQ